MYTIFTIEGSKQSVHSLANHFGMGSLAHCLFAGNLFRRFLTSSSFMMLNADSASCGVTVPCDVSSGCTSKMSKPSMMLIFIMKNPLKSLWLFLMTKYALDVVLVMFLQYLNSWLLSAHLNGSPRTFPQVYSALQHSLLFCLMSLFIHGTDGWSCIYDFDFSLGWSPFIHGLMALYFVFSGACLVTIVI